MTLHGSQRLFLKELDSVEQRAGWDAAPGDARDVTGLLRLAALLGENLVVTSTQVLDGRWLLELGPDGVRNLIGRYDAATWRRVLPLEISGNAPSFSEALVWLLHRPQDGEMLRPFQFSSLDDRDTRVRVEDLLPKIAWPAFSARLQESRDVAEAVARLLATDCGVPEPVASALEHRWRCWLEAEEAGEVEFVSRQGDADFERALNNHTEPPSSMRRPDLPKAGQNALDRIAESPRLSRTDVRKLFESLRETSPDHHARLVDWHDRGYNRAIAWQHDADFVSLGAPARPSAQRSLGLFRPGQQAAPKVLTYSVPEDVRQALRTMAPDAYDVLRHDARDAIENFWERGTGSARHRLAFELDALLRRDSRASVLGDAAARCVLGITAALAGWYLGHLNSVWWAIAVVLAVAAVAVSPDFRRLYKALVAPRGVIDLRGEA